jgi:hypothetical protein
LGAVLVLFPRDPLAPGRVDPYFARQAAAVGTTALIDHDAAFSGDLFGAVRRTPHDAGPAWYRGWIIPADRYADLATALADRGTPLQITADQYRRARRMHRSRMWTRWCRR